MGEQKSFREKAKERVIDAKVELGTEVIDDDGVMAIIGDLYQEQLKLKEKSWKKKEKKFEREIEELKTRLKRFVPKDVTVRYDKNWHANIKEVVVEIFTIECLWDKYACPYCNAFEEQGFLNQLETLDKTIGLPEEKFSFMVHRCDYADRFFSSRDFEGYTLKLSEKGEAYYYARGIGINKFPALDVTIYFKNEKVSGKKIDFFRRKGLGQVKKFDEDGVPYMEIQFGDFMNSVLNYFKAFNLRGGTFLTHLNDDLDNDPLIDKSRKKRYA